MLILKFHIASKFYVIFNLLQKLFESYLKVKCLWQKPKYMYCYFKVSFFSRGIGLGQCITRSECTLHVLCSHFLTHYDTMPHFDALKIAVENIVRKGEIACNKQFLHFSQCFLPYVALIFHLKCTLKCRPQFVSIWISLNFFRLVMG